MKLNNRVEDFLRELNELAKKHNVCIEGYDEYLCIYHPYQKIDIKTEDIEYSTYFYDLELMPGQVLKNKKTGIAVVVDDVNCDNAKITLSNGLVEKEDNILLYFEVIE